MSTYVNKIASLEEKKLKLLNEQKNLIDRRKLELGELAEKFGLLTVSDEIVCGAFSYIKKCLEQGDNKIKEWEEYGISISKPKKNKSKITKD